LRRIPPALLSRRSAGSAPVASRRQTATSASAMRWSNGVLLRRRRLACDAKVLVSADGPDGQSLNLGRTRRDPTDAQRIVIRRRDKGCRFPGCTHTEFTDVHHVLHWINGGLTDLHNLVELCDEHHRAVHEMGWHMSGDANVELMFRSPTGRLTTSTPSPVFTSARDGPPR